MSSKKYGFYEKKKNQKYSYLLQCYQKIETIFLIIIINISNFVHSVYVSFFLFKSRHLNKLKK